MSELSQFSMLELFRVEAESQTIVLTEGLLAAEKGDSTAAQLESMMRAAHSIKGAARIVEVEAAVKVAHAMEDCFVACQKGCLKLEQMHVDLLLSGVDLLTRLSKSDPAELSKLASNESSDVSLYVQLLRRMLETGGCVAVASSIQGVQISPATPPPQRVTAPAPPPPAESPAPVEAPETSGLIEMEPSSKHPPVRPEPAAEASSASPPPAADHQERILRVKAEHVNRMLGLAGESLVESRWLRPFAESLVRLKQLHINLGASLQSVQDSLRGVQCSESVEVALAKARQDLATCRELLTSRHAELDMFDRRSSNLSHRLYHEALACRMRPFSDGLRGFARMARDVARALGKEVDFQVIGPDTQVDRDILEKLEAPLMHLVRNALDHGLEFPEEREAMGKPRKGRLIVEARHSAGRLVIVVAEDGRGIETERVRRTVVKRGLTTAETAGRLSTAELLEFLFLPGFSVKEEVTEISGRGVGLDVVQSVVKSVRGTIRVSSEKGKGTRFTLQLPLTLSVLRTLLVEISGEPYAFPLGQVLRTLKLSCDQIESTEARQHFSLEGRQIALLSASQIVGRECTAPIDDELCVVVLGESNQRYGLVVDRFLGEKELVVQPLDSRLGKVKDFSSGSVMENGSPVLIVDVEDMIRSIEKLADGGTLAGVASAAAAPLSSLTKRVLVVDDSLTVRELERKLLLARGYEVEVAVDGTDGWNVLRQGRFDLLITDVDMPRMDGVELIKLVKADLRLRSIPAMIVSYKDREEDRRRGLEAGADYYLSKGSFHDDRLIRAVEDLIGQPRSDAA